MLSLFHRCIGVTFAALAVSVACAQTTFTSNTTINDGDFTFDGQDIVVQGCTVTINGEHSFNSMIVRRSGTNVAGVITHGAAFSNGTVNGVALTINTDMTIEGQSGSLVASRVDVNARGFAGGNGPGAGAAAIQAPGGAYGGNGGTGNVGSGVAGGNAYGSLSQPADLGSGGGNDSNSGAPGATGGGCVRLIVVGTLSVNGSINANGGAGGGTEPGGGAGGSVWISAGTIAGAGSITCNGTNANTTWSGGGGGGRIAIYAPNLFGGTLQAKAGGGFGRGGAGTIFQKAGSADPALIVDAGLSSLGASTPVGGVATFASIDVRNAADMVMASAVSVSGNVTASDASLITMMGSNAVNGNVLLTGGSSLTHPASVAGCHLTVGNNLTVGAGCSINVNGKGFAGGTGPGRGTAAIQAPGAGYGGNGGTSNPVGPAPGVAYGSTSQPTDLGSGGGNDSNSGVPGASGGGAIRITVGNQLLVDGSITANGGPVGTNEPGGGSGGSVWIETQTLAGGGTIASDGSNANTTWSGGGGGGRVAIYYDALTFVGTIRAQSGNGNGKGGAGTIYLKDSASSLPDLRFTSNLAGAALTPVNDVAACRDLTVSSNSNVQFVNPIAVDGAAAISGASMLTIDGANSVGGALTVSGSSSITHSPAVANMHLTVIGNATIDASSSVQSNGKGFPGGAGPGRGGNSIQASGAGYGGVGGIGNVGNGLAGGLGYGSVTQPLDLGSGGGNDTNSATPGASGGGAIRLTIGGTLLLNGTIASNGGAVGGTEPGGGSGGSVLINATSLAGNGSITANGSNANTSWSGGGGGGRIAVYHGGSSFTGTMQAFGGSGFSRAGAGTVFVKNNTRSLGDLVVANGGTNGQRTDIPAAMSACGGFTCSGSAFVVVDQVFSCDSLSVAGGATLTHTALNPGGLRLIVSGDATVTSGSFINTTGLGYTGGNGPGTGQSAIQAAGAGYGGRGGNGNPSAVGGSTYGYREYPNEFGSGGGNDTNAGIPGSPGGGLIHLGVGGTFTVDGTISCNGGAVGSFEPGGGSGGAVFIKAGALQGSGILTANGANANTSYSGGGGGGRVAIYTCTQLMSLANIRANGGTGFRAGAAGTIFFGSGTIEITQQPQSQTYVGFDPVELTVVATGDGPLSYQWRFNGSPVVDDFRISGSNSATLSINPILCDDSGVWDVLISDSCGTFPSNAALLTVNARADFNHDGFLSGEDFDNFVVAYESGDMTADFDHDGFITGIDFDSFVQAFEEGC